MIGYEIESVDINLAESSNKIFNFSLRQTAIKITEIEISSTVPQAWKKVLKRFTSYFLGASRNASRCTILNPQYLDFRFHSESDRFSASSSQPISIENRALGYQISFGLEDFMGQSFFEVQYWGTAKFDTLISENEKEKNKWRKNRQETYKGSIRHFFSALASETLEKENFIVYRSTNIPGRYGTIYQKELNIDEIVTSGPKDYERILSFDEFLKISYTGEEEPDEYALSVHNNFQINPIQARKNHQTSWIEMTTDSVIFNIDGILYQPYALISYGYWGWERIAEILPLDFKPAKKK